MKHRKIDKAQVGRAKLDSPKIDKAQLKAAIEKVKDRKRPDFHLLQMAQQSKRVKLQRKLGKQLRPLFAGAAFDAKKIDKVLAENQTDLRAALKREKTASAKRLTPFIKQSRQGIANTRKALDQIKLQPYVTTPIPITTPYLIYATPVGMLHDTHVEPWNNWAKFTYSSDQDTGNGNVVVNFYFAWQNKSDYLAVINCSTALLLNGIIEATADPGWLEPGSASLDLWATLTVFAGSTPITWQSNQQKHMGQVYTEAGWSGFGSPGTIEAENIFGSYALSCNDIQVQSNQIVVFEVACSAKWWIDLGGSIVLDFDFDPAGYRVACPALQVDLLTAPQGPIETVLAR
jgi:hypothetical protein